MRTSEPAAGLFCALLAAAVLSGGCARSASQPPAPPDARTPTRPPAASSAPAGAPLAPPVLDPTEEITPAELESIPEPAAGDLNLAGAGSGSTPPSGGGSPPSGPPGASPGSSEGAAPDSAAIVASHVWRVQIFAAQDLSLADRKAKEVEARLGVRAHLEYETPFYKVRLGDYPSEAEAQALRERAIEAGYTGAFRVRCEPDTTGY